MIQAIYHNIEPGYNARVSFGNVKEDTNSYDPLAGLRGRTSEMSNKRTSSPSIYDQLMSQGRTSVTDTLSHMSSPRRDSSPLGYRKGSAKESSSIYDHTVGEYPRQTTYASESDRGNMYQDQYGKSRKPSIGENLKSVSASVNDYSNMGYRRSGHEGGSIKSPSPLLEAIAGYTKPGAEQYNARMTGLQMEKDEEDMRMVMQNRNKKTKKRKFPVTVNLSGTRYDVGKGDQVVISPEHFYQIIQWMEKMKLFNWINILSSNQSGKRIQKNK